MNAPAFNDPFRPAFNRKERSMRRLFTFVGARGGHGTTTIAALAALAAACEQTTVLLSPDPAATAALVGIPLSVGREHTPISETLTLTADPAAAAHATTVVVDGGTLTQPWEPDLDGLRMDERHRYLVLRGPCYVALATALVTPVERLDGIVLLAEPERALRGTDATDVLGIPVVATLPQSSAIARAIDAGLLAARHTRLRPAAQLRPLVCDPFHRVQDDTDLQRPLCGRRGCALSRSRRHIEEVC
jgi:hypothetical protein